MRTATPSPPVWIPLMMVLLAATGCTSTANVYRSHTLMFSGEGQPLHIDSHPVGQKPKEKTSDQGEECSNLEEPLPIQRQHNHSPVLSTVNSWRGLLPNRYFQVESCKDHQEHLDQIFDGLLTSGKKKVLIYIHGGLNDIAPTLKREQGLIECATQRKSVAERDCVEDDFYPIFINWSASLRSNYRDHLFRIRQGQVKSKTAKLTFPFVLAEDLISAVASSPSAMTEELTDGYQEPRNDIWQAAKKRYQEGKLGLDAYLGEDLRSRGEKITTAISWFPVGLVKVVTTPAIQGLGQPAWEVLNRRASLLLEKEGFPRYPGEDQSTGDGPLSPFFRRLQRVQEKHPDLELTIIGHSMGAIILNKTIRHFPRIDFKNIVYMAAACSLDDYQDTMFPYLAAHDKTQLYHLTLHEMAELQESHKRWLEVAPRGSLLVWIDNFLEDPRYRLDRTAGRIFNLLRETERTPEPIRDQIHIKAFSYGKSVAECQPHTHGGLDDFPFWKEDYWKPSTGRRGCTEETERGADAPATQAPPGQ
jgi:pimeloyl-ACP methyl ester carboxylesterase